MSNPYDTGLHVLYIVPADPWWQPGLDAGERAAEVAAALLPTTPEGFATEVEVSWYDLVRVIDAGANLTRIGCRRCGASIDHGWWADLTVTHSAPEGLTTLSAVVPCCRAETSLDELEFDGPCGFSRFAIAVWRPDRSLLTEDESARIAETLGHPVRQIAAVI